MGNFERCVNWTLDQEGGTSNHRSDRGGLTHYGIAKVNHAAAFGGKPPTRQLAEAWAREHVWVPIQGDALPVPLDLVVFDAAFHSSPERSVKRMQRSLGLTGRQVDGKVGPNTLRAIELSDHFKVAHAMLLARAAALTAQIRAAPSQIDFLGGWWARTLELAIEVGE